MKSNTTVKVFLLFIEDIKLGSVERSSKIYITWDDNERYA